MTVYGLNLLWLSIKSVQHDTERPGEVPDAGSIPTMHEPWPDVTIQLPVFNEANVIERLIDTTASIVYPRDKLQIQVLDDSNDDTVALAAERVAFWKAKGFMIEHVRRADRAGYKAGALEEALDAATGDFIAIFDADFLPTEDFLLHMLPLFDAPDIGMVQARWGHLNADHSLLTKVQAFGLDAHFALEQFVRNRAGCFMNFNGTAGIWRRTCIEESGNWQPDTLAEDLDLSYRAQLRGWRFKYNEDVEVPAELPENINALRSQQFRWTKGAAEVGQKLLGRLWKSGERLQTKIEGTFQLTAHFVFPFILIVIVLHAPLLMLKHVGKQAPGEIYFGFLGLGLLGFLGFMLAQVFSQRVLYPDWPRRILFFPVYMAGTMGLAINNCRALFQAFRGKKTAFIRTPKFSRAEKKTVRQNYVEKKLPLVAWFEGLTFVYSLVGLGFIIAFGEWAATPFQSLFVLGFGMVTYFNLKQHFS